MKVSLVRHLSPLIEPGICYGRRLDIPMRPDRRAAAAHLAADPALHGAAQVWTSPALRCRALADLIASAVAVPLTVDARLQEIDFGAWEGKAWDAIDRAELDRWAAAPATFQPPGGESGAALVDRVRSVHTDILRDGQDCVIVSHGGPLKMLAALLRGEPVDLLAPAPEMGSIIQYELS